MGIFEKVKNMFTEEIDEDNSKVEKIKSEVTHVEIKSPKVVPEDDINSRFANEFATKKEPVKPVFFDDNDFNLLEEEQEKKEIKKPDVKIYGGHVKEEKKEEEKKVFKPTPIISPVYGVLDKNYHKDDIVSRKETKYESSTTISDIDKIRDKAYGTLEDELENTLFSSNSILFKKEENEEEKDNIDIAMDDDVLNDLTDDIGKELDELLVKKEKFVSSSNDLFKDDDLNEDDLLGFIDSTLYKDGD